MTETVGGPIFSEVYTSPPIVECSCDECECPNLAEGSDRCLGCKHGAHVDDTE